MRRVVAVVVLMLLAGVPAVAHIRGFVIGHSERGRTIRAVERGDPSAPHRLLVFGLIHGNEPAGIAVARKLAATSPPPGLDVTVVEDLNPDGRARDTRQNARGVDLNRNFSYRWRHLDHRGGIFWSGPGPVSESETKAAQALILRLRPTITVWYHQHLDVVDLAGGDARIERRYARLVGMRTGRLPRYPGSASTWENHAFPGTTSFVVELHAGSLSAGEVQRHVRALLAIAR